MPQDFRSELRYEGLIVRVNLLPSSVLGIPMNPCQCLPYHSGLEEHGHLLRLIPDTETRTTHIRSTSIRRTSRNCGRMEFGCIPKSIPVPMDRLGGSLPVSSEACAAVFAHSAQPLQQSSSADTDNSRCGADDADRRGGLHRDAARADRSTSGCRSSQSGQVLSLFPSRQQADGNFLSQPTTSPDASRLSMA